MKMMKKRWIDVPFRFDAVVKSKSTAAKIYKGATILTPGRYADRVTKDWVIWRADVLRKYATNWSSNYLNVDHSHSVLHRIGYVENPRWEDNAVKADLYIFPYTSAGRDVINLIDNGLVNSLSAEVATIDSYNYKEKAFEVEEIEFIGCAVVTEPACEEAKIKDD